MNKRVVIIGNGIAGTTAARFIRKASDAEITIISSESDYFFSRTALMYVYMGHLRLQDTKPYEDWFWDKNRIRRIRGYVERVDTELRRLHLGGAGVVDYDVLVIATGSQPNRFGWEGDDLPGVQGLYSLQDLELLEQQTRGIRRAAVVGGGLVGIELAEMLRSRHIEVSFLVREASYMDYVLPPEESEMVNRQIRRHGVDLKLGTEVRRIVANDAGRAGKIQTKSGDDIDVDFVGLTLGVRPNIGFIEDGPIETGRGVIVNDRFETSVDGIYAIGDCAQFRDPETGHKEIEQLWYSGRAHGKTVARTICGRPTSYDRGVFYNSAKFFDLEYQTYGTVEAARPAGLDDHIVSGSGTDDLPERLVRIRYDQATGSVVGFNGFGVRLRHEVCERWIRGGSTIEEVRDGLGLAVFDPEFTRRLVDANAA